MSLKDDFFMVLRNISNRKLRSWLTVLGVVIGVASIIALTSVSRSLEMSIKQEFESFGSDKVTIYAKGGVPGYGTGLNRKDVEAVEKVKGLEYAAPFLTKSSKVKFKDKANNLLIFGIPSDTAEKLFSDLNLGFQEGASFESDSKKIVVGPRAAYDLFDRKLSVKSKVEIEGEKFEVAGILEPVGNPADDSQVYMPLDVMRELFGDKDGVSLIWAKVNEGGDVDEAAEKITESLKKVRSEESFTVVTPEQLLEQLGAVLGILQAVLVGIAGISLVVGSVGIASSMYTSVVERTRDIGIMKAIGASNREITAIFLIEAGLVGLVGGIIGVFIGFLIAKAISFGAAQAGFTFLKIFVEPQFIAIGLAFAVIVGMASGFFPARQAARLKPVDALRK